MKPLRALCAAAAIASTSTELSTPARAGEGPATGGAGLATEAGTTIGKGRIELSTSTHWTRFEDVSTEEAIAGAIAHGEHDAADYTIVQYLGMRYGISDNVEVGARTAYTWVEDLIVARPDGILGATVGEADVSGIGDLWMSGKWRFHQEANTHVAALFGIKLPYGEDGETDSLGTRIDPSNQPSTGAVDYQGGLSYTRELTSQLFVDASALYTLRGRDQGFQVGDRFDAGLLLVYALENEPQSFPHWSVSGELFVTRLEQDEDHDVLDPNSGSTTFFLVPGMRCQWNEHTRLRAEIGIPVSEDLTGEQANTRVKAALGIEVAF